MKVYIDGDQITSFSSSTYPALNQDLYTVMAGGYHILGLGYDAKFDGYIAEVNLIENQQLTPSTFGVTDTSTGRWVPSTIKPYPTTTTTFTVTVADASGNKYFIDSSQQATVTLIEGATYRFDQSDSSNAGHPLRFSTTSNGTHSSGVEFTSGVVTAGTPGSSGAYTEITVPTGTATLYYYCTNHSGMGGQANTQDQYGTNGFRLQFQDSSSLGDDTSVNTNDFTATNLASTDQTTDSPTQNFATFSPSFSSSTMGLTEGNLTVTDNGGTTWETAFVGKPVQSGKWYFEATVDVAGAYDTFFGVSTLDALATNKAQYNGYANGSAGYQAYSGSGGSIVYHGNNGGNYYYPGDSTGFSNGDKIGIAYDADTGAFWASKNNTWINSGNPSTGANPLFSGYTAQQLVYFGLSNATNGTKHSVNFGQRSFAYTPPTGFSALQQDNMQATDKGISGLSWVKDRDSSSHFHTLYDSSRGVMEEIYSNSDSQQATQNNGLHKFLKGGFQTGDAINTNTSGNSFVSWNWVANGGTTATNNDGSIASVVQANQTAGFSIVQYTGTGSNATVGHGLSSAPEWIFGRPIEQTGGYNWSVYHKSLTSASYYLSLNLTNAETSNSNVWGSAPTSSVINIGTSMSASTEPMILYCWHSVDGYSKFGKYVGNGSASDGPFIYTGFKPAMVMVKEIDTASYDWQIWDSTRSPINPITNQALFPNSTNAEGGTNVLDFLSNGFKWRSNGAWLNNSGNKYIYMAFAEHPLTGNGVSPVTAR